MTDVDIKKLALLARIAVDEEEMQETVSNVAPKENSPYKVEFEHVQFGYGDEPEDPLLMTDFNLT